MLKDGKIHVKSGGVVRPGMSLSEFHAEVPSAELYNLGFRVDVESYSLGVCILDGGREYTGTATFRGNRLTLVALHDPEISALGWAAMDDKDLIARVKARNDEYLISLFGAPEIHPPWGYIRSVIEPHDGEPVIFVGHDLGDNVR